MDGRELRVFNERTMEAQCLRRENQWLRGDRDYLRAQLFHADQRFAELRDRCERLAADNDRLRRQVDELRAARVAGAADADADADADAGAGAGAGAGGPATAGLDACGVVTCDWSADPPAGGVEL